MRALAVVLSMAIGCGGVFASTRPFSEDAARACEGRAPRPEPTPGFDEGYPLPDSVGASAYAWSPDGALLATGEGTDVKLFDRVSARAVRTIGIGGHVTGVAFDPTGVLLAVASCAPRVGIYEVATGRRVRTIVSRHAAWLVAWSTSLFAIGSDEGHVELFDSAGTLLHERPSPGPQSDLPYVLGLSFDRTGARLAVVTGDHHAFLLDQAAGAVRETTIDPYASSVAFADGDEIAIGASDREEARVYSLATDPPVLERRVGAGAGQIVALAWQGDTLAMQTRSGDLIVGAATGETRARFFGASWYAAFGTAPHVQLLPSGAIAVGARVFDDHGQLVVRLTTSTPTIEELAWRGSRIAVRYDQGPIALWDVSRRYHRRELWREASGHTVMALSEDGSELAVGYHDGRVRIFDAESGAARERIASIPTYVRALAYARDGRAILAGALGTIDHHSSRTTDHVYRLEAGRERPTAAFQHGVPGTSAIVDTERGVLTLDELGFLRRFVAGRVVQEIDVGYAFAISASPRGVDVVGRATLRRAGPEDAQTLLRASTCYVAAAFSEEQIALATSEGTIEIVDRTSLDRRVLRARDGVVRALAFSPDGRFLAIGSQRIRFVRLSDGASVVVHHTYLNGRGQWLARDDQGEVDGSPAYVPTPRVGLLSDFLR